MLLLSAAGYSQDAGMIYLKDTAHLFGPGSISTGDFVFNATFTPDGNTVFFTKATVNWNYIVIFYSTRAERGTTRVDGGTTQADAGSTRVDRGAARTGGGWTPPCPVPFTGVYRDTDPFVQADGKRLYFTSDRPEKGGSFKDYNYQLFYVDLHNGEPGTNPIEVDVPLGKIHLNYPSISANGNLYFSGSDTAGDSDIWLCTLENGVYKAPVKLPFNDAHLIDFDPVVAKDESFIIFSSVNRKGLGSVDLWVSFKKGNVWSTPVNMGRQVNSVGHEGAPGLSPDNTKLYFSANHERVTQRPSYPNGKPTAAAVEAYLHSPADGLNQLYEIDISDLPRQKG